MIKIYDGKKREREVDETDFIFPTKFVRAKAEKRGKQTKKKRQTMVNSREEDRHEHISTAREKCLP